MQSIQIQRQRQFNMPALMPRDVLFDTALLRYCFDAVLAVGVTGNWQQFVPFGHAVVFLDDVSGNVQQPDIRFDACFLAVRVDPQMPVERGAQVGFRQVRHIRPAQTRKGAEDEQIADQLVAFLFKLNITNLQRLMSDPYVREHLGLEINNGILVSKVKVSEVIKGLLKVVTDILNPEFKVSDIYNREKRKQYIDNFDKSQKPDLSNEASEQWSVQDIENNKEQASRNSEKQEIKGDKNRKTRDRGALVPKSLNLHISNPKINKIFEELKHVQVKTCPNASSVLLRVFLELSVDAYLEKFDLVRNNAITACSSGESLQGKVGKVLNHMTQLGTMSNDLSKGIRSEINDKNSVLSIESLNAYVHNEFFYPKADNLITGWDNIESFFIQLWESIKNKE